MSITCRKCGVYLNDLNRSASKVNWCKSCYNAEGRDYRLVAGDRIRDKERRNTKSRNAKLKGRVFEAYGNTCFCCGEARAEFLTIDHVNGDGAEQRRVRKHRGSGRLFYLDIIRANFPPEYRLACMNCNYARRWGKKCPHETERESARDIAAD